jgi:hypothetical protein
MVLNNSVLWRYLTVTPGLVPGIHALLLLPREEKDVDGRDKPGHDGHTCALVPALFHRPTTHP